MNLTVEWRVAPEHAHLLPATEQTPQLPITICPPQQHDVVELSDGQRWQISLRWWERQPGQQVQRLVLWIAPLAPGTPDRAGHTLH